MDTLPDPSAVKAELIALLREEVICQRNNDQLVLDTPHTLLDGRLLRVCIMAGSDGQLIVDDTGYATAQVDIFAANRDIAMVRYAEMQRIAQELEIEWDGRFWFAAPNLTTAMQRIAVLGWAVNRALALNEPDTGRKSAVPLNAAAPNQR